jgi:hypothetical protein
LDSVNISQVAQSKVTGAQRIKVGIIAAGVFVGATTCVLLLTHPSQAPSLSLVFEKYGSTTDVDFNVQDVAFLKRKIHKRFTDMFGSSSVDPQSFQQRRLCEP